MGFQNFLGNTATVTHLRESVRANRFPQSMILAGPKGAGKFTLALMLAQAVNCLEPTESDGLPDFCGHCSNCTRIAESANLDDRVAEAVAAREDMRDADKRETRIFIQTHPDVLVVPPDPPQLLIKLGQVRQVIHNAYYRPPIEARRAFAARARADSKAHTGSTMETIMDVNADAVAQAMRDAGVTRLIHGHTHRPAIHRFTLDGQPAERIVLGDWYDQGSVLRVTPVAVELRGLAA